MENNNINSNKDLNNGNDNIIKEEEINENANENENENENKNDYNQVQSEINDDDKKEKVNLNKENHTNNETQTLKQTNLDEEGSSENKKDLNKNYINNNNNNNNNNNQNNNNCNCFLICKCYDYGKVKHNTIEDIEILRSSIGFFKCDDTSITSILSQRNWSEKNLIIKKYSDKYNRQLIKDLRSHTHGNYKNAIQNILTEPSIYDTIQVRKSLTSKKYLNFNEIFISRNNQQKEMIKRIYLIKYNCDLDQDIVGKYKGDIRELTLAMVQNLRDNDNSSDFESVSNNQNNMTMVDMKLVEEDSNRLYQAGEGQKGTDIKPFIEIFTKRSFAHLTKLNTFYQNANPKGHSLVRGIELEFEKGKVKNTLLDILLYANEPFKYWAECFNRALSGWGTNENDLTRLSITQHYQASNIKQAYLSCYNQSLVINISKKTSRSKKYKKLLLLLVNV